MTSVVTVFGVTGAVVGVAMSSSGVTSSTEFSSMAARYQEYRVRAMRVKWRPHPSQAVASDLGQSVSAVWTAAAAPSTLPSFAACDGFHACSNLSMALDMTASWEINPNAKLWCDRGSSIPTANSFGVSFRFADVCSAALNGYSLVQIYAEYDVEWRTAL